jgi:ATP synthase F1 gamma subunit
MASMKDIKRRKSSIQSTQQITKAMKLVSTVKLQKAKGRAEQTNPYFNYMYQTVSSMLAKSGNINHPLSTIMRRSPTSSSETFPVKMSVMILIFSSFTIFG